MNRIQQYIRKEYGAELAKEVERLSNAVPPRNSAFDVDSGMLVILIFAFWPVVLTCFVLYWTLEALGRWWNS